MDPLLIIIILIIILLAIAGGFLLFYYRDYIFQRGVRKTVTDAEIEAYLDQIRQQARANNFTEAALLIWRTFSAAAGGFLFVDRMTTQTARQYGLQVSIQFNLDQTAVMNVVELFEKARYGISPISVQEFNEGLSGLHRFLQAASQLSIELMRQQRGVAA